MFSRKIGHIIYVYETLHDAIITQQIQKILLVLFQRKERNSLALGIYLKLISICVHTYLNILHLHNTYTLYYYKARQFRLEADAQ